MNKKIETFLDDVCVHVRCKTVHRDIRDELANHIYELKAEYESEGYDEKKALDMAISAMGNCDEIGERLNKQHKPETEWSLIGLTAIIAVIGGIIMYTSSRLESIQSVSFEKYLIYALIGTGVMVGLYFFDYTKLKKAALPFYLISLLLMLIALFSGAEFNGRRFFAIGGILISSEFVTVFLLIALAGFIEKGRGKGGIAVAGILLLALVSVIPILALPNRSMALFLITSYALLIVSAVIKNHFGGYRKIQLTSLGCIGALFMFFITCSIITDPNRLERIKSFTTRGQSDPLGGGWQQMMADKWLAASNLFGKTTETVYGYGIDKGMPGITADYVLINIIATLGWVVGIALVLAITVLIGRMLVTTKKIKNDYGFYLSLGACTNLSVKFITSVLVNFNLFPPMSVSLPFVSYGGIGYIVSMALVGIILSVWRRNNLIGASQSTVVRSKSRFIEFVDGKLIINFK
ncbi:MAG: FtsW/RodA/SpoVE family cell cycle protein [Clostridiaceae bacterium]|nr:FtsW/RodA/SpoVE family cell cycle protein [Clostridiaceae bacterium]